MSEVTSEEEVTEPPERASIIIVSDVVCPWCYIGLTEIERLKQEYDFDVHFAPYLLRPETPPEGMPPRRITPMDAPPTPIEQRGEKLGIKFTRGRTWSSWSHLALEADEYAQQETDKSWEFHKRLYKAYFDELKDVANIDILVGLAEDVGIEGEAMRDALAERRYEAKVDEGIEWSRQIGVTAVPTFVFNERMGMVGAQELPAFREMMQRIGNPPKAVSG